MVQQLAEMHMFIEWGKDFPLSTAKLSACIYDIETSANPDHTHNKESQHLSN